MAGHLAWGVAQAEPSQPGRAGAKTRDDEDRAGDSGGQGNPTGEKAGKASDEARAAAEPDEPGVFRLLGAEGTDEDGDGIRECHDCPYGEEGEPLRLQLMGYTNFPPLDRRAAFGHSQTRSARRGTRRQR